ncbi:hypothetical protein [Aquimarina sp. MMG016]|uniref:hypothetical protein n=1 Tax=Aquimarina sp. MMG016 TaxID=2822690 RepID=UPI001B3A2478|nr:hypothetical protein [Aquimarina sp. MMG016]MBQ4821579.1 hypothetical protein [Aquimarina sp. MMG016]
MTYSKILFFVVFFTFSNSIHSQFTPKPSLNFKKTSTLVIDSIPVLKFKEHNLSDVMYTSNEYSVFFSLPYNSQFPSLSISRFNPYATIRRDAFNHESLFDPMVYESLERRSWDNPTGTNSFGVGVSVGVIQTLFSLF